MRDRQTGRPRGFGFVTFTSPAAADAVVEDVHVIDGRQVRGPAAAPGMPDPTPAGRAAWPRAQNGCRPQRVPQ